MIDTVALRIDPFNSYSSEPWNNPAWAVQDPEQFNNPDIENCYGSNWHKENKRSEAKQWKDYLPHVEIRQGNRPVYYYLYVRFSVPKLIYGDNLKEVTDPHFNTVCQTLQSKLQRMGIKVDLTAIKYAQVEQVHYGKNLICYGIPVELVLNRLAAAKPPRRLRMDIQKTTYCNGRQLTFHNKIREICLYDKYQELLAHRKQAKKLAWFFGRKDLKNLLRLEVRLNHKTSFKKHFGTNKVMFQDVFSAAISKQVILAYWEPIYTSVAKIPPVCYAPEYQLLSLGDNNPNMINDLELVGLRAVVNSMGYVAAYKLIQARYPGQKQRGYALFAKLQKATPLVIPAKYDYLRMIDNELRQFKWLGKYAWGKRKKLLRDTIPLTYQKLLTVEDVAKYAKVNKRTVQRWLQDEKVGHFKFGNQYRLRTADLFALLCGPKP